MQRSDDMRLVHQVKDLESEQVVVASTVVAHPSLAATQATTPPIVLDPLYSPLVEAVALIRQTIDAQHYAELEALKRSTADQTENLYHKLTEARELFDSLEQTHAQKLQELESLTEQLKTSKDMQITQENSHHEEIQTLTQKHDDLLNKLREKINNLDQDHQQQLDNLQSQLSFQKIHYEEQLNLLTEENIKITHELDNIRRDQYELNQLAHDYQEKLAATAHEITHLQTLCKEKEDKLLRAEHGLRLAHEEVERNQRYIQELEEKNNTIQKELFENWIQKKEEL